MMDVGVAVVAPPRQPPAVGAAAGRALAWRSTTPGVALGAGRVNCQAGSSTTTISAATIATRRNGC